jgi:zinc transport system substrate-binding protein
MNMRSGYVRFGLALVAAAGLGAATLHAGDKLNVAVSIVPEKTFVEKIGGEHVSVQVLVGPSDSPHSFEPTARQLTELSQAAIYFRIGVGFEAGMLPRIEKMFPKMRIVDLRERVPLRDMSADGHDHDHGHDHGHAHDDAHDHGHDHDDGHACTNEHGKDPHIWLSPRLVKVQAQTICTALIEADPAHAADYRANLEKFQAALEQVHDEIAKALKPLKGRNVYVFHPAFGYFLDEFGLRQVPVEVGGKEPSAKQLAQLIQRAKAENVRVIFVQPQFPKKSVQAVADAIGGAVVPIDPLAADYLENLRRIAQAISDGLSKPKTD